MGRMATIEMVEAGGNTDAVLGWHLSCNHYPPLLDAVPFARMAIEAVEAGHGMEPIDDGVSRRAPSAWDVVTSWHLEEFVVDPFNVFSEFGPDFADAVDTDAVDALTDDEVDAALHALRNVK